MTELGRNIDLNLVLLVLQHKHSVRHSFVVRTVGDWTSLPLDPSAAEFRRRRKKFGTPPRQPKFTEAAAAAIFAARRGASDFNSL